MPSESRKSSPSSRLTTARRVWNDVAYKELPRITIGLTALIINAITNLSFPLLLGQAVDKASASDEAAYTQFLIQSGGVFAIGSIASFFRIWAFNTATDRIASALRRSLFESYMRKSLCSDLSTPSAEMSMIMEADVTAAAEMYTERLAAALRSLNSSVIGSISLFRVSPELCGVTLSIVPVISIGAMALNRHSKALFERVRQIQSSVLSYTLERFGALTTVQLNNAVDRELRSFARMDSDLVCLSAGKHTTHAALMAYLTAATNVSLLAVLAVGGRLIARGNLTPGTLSRFAIQSAFVALGFGGLSTVYSDLTKALDAGARVFDEMDSSLSVVSTEPPPTTGVGVTPASSIGLSVIYDNVSYTYPSRSETAVLNSVCASVQPCSLTCISGKSGSGKSTMLLLTTGLLRLQNGNISVNGDDIASIDKHWLRNKEEEDVSDTDLILACKQADAFAFIEALPDRLHTFVGEKGSQLSGGQRTRVMIARALLRRPSLLLLDEPTSSVDEASEVEIIDTLLRLKADMTIIVCSHSAAVIRAADCVYHIDEGKLTRQ